MVGLPRTSGRFVADAANHTTFNKQEKKICREQESNPRSHQASSPQTYTLDGMTTVIGSFSITFT